MSEVVFKIGHWSIAVADDEPTAAIQVAEWLTWGNPSGSRSMERSRALVEIYRSLGGRNSRALLGGELDRAGDLCLRVGQSSAIRVGGATSCHSRLGRDLVPGLPPEFAPTVLLTLSKELQTVGSGTVTIDRAAHDDVDSSSKAFEQASVVLLHLLHARALHVDEEAALEDVVRSW